MKCTDRAIDEWRDECKAAERAGITHVSVAIDGMRALLDRAHMVRQVIAERDGARAALDVARGTWKQPARGPGRGLGSGPAEPRKPETVPCDATILALEDQIAALYPRRKERQ